MEALQLQHALAARAALFGGMFKPFGAPPPPPPPPPPPIVRSLLHQSQVLVPAHHQPMMSSRFPIPPAPAQSTLQLSLPEISLEPVSPTAVASEPSSPSPTSTTAEPSFTNLLQPAEPIQTQIGNGATSLLAQALAKNVPRRPRGEKKPIPDNQKDNRYFERRRRNNLAAKKSRDQRKQREESVALRAGFLEKENAVLRAQLSNLTDERNSLQSLLLKRSQMKVLRAAAEATAAAAAAAAVTPPPAIVKTKEERSEDEELDASNSNEIMDLSRKDTHNSTNMDFNRNDTEEHKAVRN